MTSVACHPGRRHPAHFVFREHRGSADVFELAPASGAGKCEKTCIARQRLLSLFLPEPIHRHTPHRGWLFATRVHADNYSYQHEDSECKIGRFKIGSDRFPAKSTACVKTRFGWPAVAGAQPTGLCGHCRYCLIVSQRASKKFGESRLGVMLENTPRLGTLAATLQTWQSATGGAGRRYTGLEG